MNKEEIKNTLEIKKTLEGLRQRRQDAEECLKELDTEFYKAVKEALILGIIEIKYL